MTPTSLNKASLELRTVADLNVLTPQEVKAVWARNGVRLISEVVTGKLDVRGLGPEGVTTVVESTSAVEQAVPDYGIAMEAEWVSMGLPRYHEQPVLLLIYRTITNYDDIKARRAHNGPFEVIQLINSFLAVVAHPWDQLLDEDQLKCLQIRERRFQECGFPPMTRFVDPGNGQEADDAYNMLRVLRNSLAHGNMELLDRKQLRKLRPTGAIPSVKEREIAALRIWNKSNTGKVTWETTLDITELESALRGMMRLCEKRSLWQPAIRQEFERREKKRLGRTG